MTAWGLLDDVPVETRVKVAVVKVDHHAAATADEITAIG